MKYVKIIGLAAAAAAALVTFGTSTVWATTLTDGSGNHPTTIEATSTEGTFSGGGGGIHIACDHSYLHGHITDNGTSSGVVGISLTYYDFIKCGSWTMTVLKPGTLSISGATVKSTGTELTRSSTSGLHCIYTTSGTTIGTLTPSSTTKSTAVLDISATLPRTGGKSGIFCGTTSAWTGNYKVISPDTLNID